MANNSIITNLGKKVILNRAFKSSPDYTVPSQFKVGISNDTPSLSDTDLDIPVPISNGTVIDNGDNTLTGTGGGTSSTDNVSIYKEGAGQTDNHSQNLLANGTSATKEWYRSPLTASFTATQPFSLWLYIADATAYAKFLSAGTAFEVRIRTSGDAANKSYYYQRTKAQLAVGWNYITSGTTNVNALSTGAGGAPSGALNELRLLIYTNNAADTFSAGDVCYDICRQWATSDLYKTFSSGYPLLDETNMEVEIRGVLTTLECNGFDINGNAILNSDATYKMTHETTHTSESKSSTDQFTFISRTRLV